MDSREREGGEGREQQRGSRQSPPLSTFACVGRVLAHQFRRNMVDVEVTLMPPDPDFGMNGGEPRERKEEKTQEELDGWNADERWHQERKPAGRG